MDMKPIELVVEDEFFLRDYAVGFLEEASLSVLQAAEPHEAISILSIRRDVGVLFTDVNFIGKTNGLQLPWEVSSRWPDIQILITSGKTRPSFGEMPPDSGFIAKPYGPKSVVSAIRDTLLH
jgi:DNA-binding NtrC family response regulator